MSNMVKLYAINYPSGRKQITYINKSRINLISIAKDPYVSFKYHVYISVGDSKELLDIVKDSTGTYWASEKEAAEFVEKTFGNIGKTESFESL